MNNSPTIPGNSNGKNVIGAKFGAVAAPVPAAVATSGADVTTEKMAPIVAGKSAPVVKITSEKHGQELLHRVEARKREFEQKMAANPNEPARDPSRAAAIEAALHAVQGLLTGDLGNINPKTAEELSLWLESSKHLSADEPQASAAPPPIPKAAIAKSPAPIPGRVKK